MVHQDVAVAQGGENALAGLGERRMGGRHERPVLERRPVDGVDLPQRREIEQPGQLDDVTGMDVEFAQ